jgi:hypothetical protein
MFDYRVGISSLSDLVDGGVSNEVHPYEIFQSLDGRVHVFEQVEEIRVIAELLSGFYDEVLEAECFLIDLLDFFERGDDELVVFRPPLLNQNILTRNLFFISLLGGGFF